MKLTYEEKIRRHQYKIYELEEEITRAEREFNNFKDEVKKETFFKIIKEEQKEIGPSKALLNFL